VPATDRKSLFALQGVGPESEAECVPFHGRRVTKVGRKSNTGSFFGLRGRPQPEKSAKADNGGSASGDYPGYYSDYYEGYPYCYDTALPLSVHLGCLLRDRKVGWHTLQP
jgi:hypothetical protein